MKQCTRCQEFKPRDFFWKQKFGEFGLRAECKSCLRFRKELKKMGLDSCIENKIKKKFKSRSKGSKRRSGYVFVCMKGHPNAKNKQGIIAQHRLLMSQHLGRPLLSGETVHHKNGIKDDNRLENLELWDRSHGPGERVEDRINWCIEYLSQYHYLISKK